MIATNVEHVRKFIQFAAKELELPTLPYIRLVGSTENRYDAFGHSKGNVIVCRITDRHPIDIMRTLAHELIHYKQNILKMHKSTNFREDQANELAGRIMQKFDTTHPEVFRDKSVRANMFTEEALGGVGANSMGGGEGIATYDPMLRIKARRQKHEFALNDTYKKESQGKSLRSVVKNKP